MEQMPATIRKERESGPARKETDRAHALLDVAEREFALHGYDGVTIRRIASEAGVDVALPSYYFGSKRELLDAVFERRAALFNSARSDALNQVAAKWHGQHPPLDEVITAFLWPIAQAQIEGDEGWRNYCRLVAQVNSSPVWVAMMTSHFDDLIRKFVGMVGQALPGAREADLYWGYHFLSGSLSLSMADTGRLQKLSGNLCRSDDFATLYKKMIDLYVAGFTAMGGARSED